MANIADGLTKWVRAIDNRTSRRAGGARAVQRFVTPQLDLISVSDSATISNLRTDLYVGGTHTRIGEFRL